MDDIKTVITFCIVLTILTVIFAVIYKTAKGSPAKKKNRTSGGTRIDDTISLVDEVEDIVDGIVICDNATRFVSGITCRGINFYEMDGVSQLKVMENYQGFINTIDTPITYRLYSRSVDISTAVSRYEQQIRVLNDDVIAAEQALMEYGKNPDYKNQYEIYKKLKDSYAFKLNHLAVQLRQMKHYSDSSVVRDVSQVYLFDFRFEPNKYEGKQNAKGRLAIAKDELATLAHAKIHALADCGVKARILNQADMLDMFRRTTQPFSAEAFSTYKLDESSYFDDIQKSATEDYLKKLRSTDV